MSIKTRLQRIANWFQPSYRKIQDWDLPWLRVLCQGLWNVLGDDVKKMLYTFVTGMAKKYGEDIAKDIMEDIKKHIDKVIGN